MTSVDQLAGQVLRQALDTVVRRCAPDLGVDPEELLDSGTFLAAARGLDPGSPGFASDVLAAARGVVAVNPGGRFTPPPPPAAPPAAAADPGEPSQWTMEDVNRASPAELSAAIAAGQMRALGVPPARRGHR
jgi:hypothetical protein